MNTAAGKGRAGRGLLLIGLLSLAFALLLWADHTFYWGVLRLDWLAGLYVLGLVCLALRSKEGTKRRGLLLGMAAACLAAMPLGFLLTRPPVTAAEAAAILAQEGGFQQVVPNEDYPTITLQGSASPWVRKGYVFQGTNRAGEGVILCFDPERTQWGELRP